MNSGAAALDAVAVGVGRLHPRRRMDDLALAAVGNRDGRNLEQGAGHDEVGHDRGAGRRIGFEERAVDLVHRGEVGRVLDVDLHRGRHRQARSGLLQRLVDALQHLGRLITDVAVGHDGARDVDESIGLGGRAERELRRSCEALHLRRHAASESENADESCRRQSSHVILLRARPMAQTAFTLPHRDAGGLHWPRTCRRRFVCRKSPASARSSMAGACLPVNPSTRTNTSSTTRASSSRTR